MTQQIYEIKHFPFSNIDLGKPYNLNGMYFIKMFVKDSPIYVQPPKCFIKQGILKSGKKWFCDLVFSIEDGYFLTWLEQMEEIAKQKIFENRTNWFETELDEHDIENSLVSPYKMFRSGKFFIIRANLPTTLDKCDLKIYDESENEIQPEDVKEETEVITILELKGIKCSARNFQFVLDVRQMLVVSPVKIFEKCIIRKTVTELDGSKETKRTNETSATMHTNQETIAYEDESSPVIIRENTLLPSSTASTTSIKQERDINETETFVHSTPGVVRTPSAKQEQRTSVGVREITGEDLSSKVIGKQTEKDSSTPVNTEMYEFEIDLADLEKKDAFQIKPRNDVYYKLYKEAKRKAKEAKLLALSNYLEAKRLKTTYLLEDSSDSSDEEDEDMDDDEHA